jgi:hypothetical protein
VIGNLSDFKDVIFDCTASIPHHHPSDRIKVIQIQGDLSSINEIVSVFFVFRASFFVVFTSHFRALPTRFDETAEEKLILKNSNSTAVASADSRAARMIRS